MTLSEHAAALVEAMAWQGETPERTTERLINECHGRRLPIDAGRMRYREETGRWPEGGLTMDERRRIKGDAQRDTVDDNEEGNHHARREHRDPVDSAQRGAEGGVGACDGEGGHGGAGREGQARQEEASQAEEEARQEGEQVAARALLVGDMLTEYTARVEALMSAGDYDGALRASRALAQLVTSLVGQGGEA